MKNQILIILMITNFMQCTEILSSYSRNHLCKTQQQIEQEKDAARREKRERRIQWENQQPAVSKPTTYIHTNPFAALADDSDEESNHNSKNTRSKVSNQRTELQKYVAKDGSVIVACERSDGSGYLDIMTPSRYEGCSMQTKHCHKLPKNTPWNPGDTINFQTYIVKETGDIVKAYKNLEDLIIVEPSQLDQKKGKKEAFIPCRPQDGLPVGHKINAEGLALIISGYDKYGKNFWDKPSK